MKKGFNIHDEERNHSSDLKRWKETFYSKAKKPQSKVPNKRKKW